MDILFASSNEHKKLELEALLAPHKIHLPGEFGLSFECTEDGTTFLENANKKAQALYSVSKSLCMPVLADDSGLIVDALPGELGVRTARFGSKDGEPVLPADVKNKLLLEKMAGIERNRRTAHFVCALVLINCEKTYSAQGETYGYIMDEISSGKWGFGYDPVFFSDEANSAFADLSPELKNLYGHRGKAARKLLDILNSALSAIPERSEISENDKWNLELLYSSNEDFSKDLVILKSKISEAELFKGKLSASPAKLLKALKWRTNTEILCERIGNYVFLNYSTQMQNPDYQKMVGTFTQISTMLASALSFMDPEILGIKNLKEWIKDPSFDDYRVSLQKLIRLHDHVLSDKEENILAQQAELQSTCSDTFEALTNTDMDFGAIDGKPLSQSTFSLFMHDIDPNVRKKAYFQFYNVYSKHEQTLSKLYSGSVKQDVFNAKIRGFESSLKASLYSDNVPESVYTGLIEAVHSAFPSLHRYYALKRKICKMDVLHHYDVYVPMADNIKTKIPYEKACLLVKEALAPLGQDYTNTIYAGLTTDRWVDRYENKGKRSGAFSSGGFIGNPYILLNYKEDSINDVFTIAHEGGHSMHSFYSKRNNPFSCYNYTIFEAEVASTFNEQLVAKYLVDTSKDEKTKTFIISKQLDDIVATLFRQTMFAEFELICHRNQENGDVLTSESIRTIYKSLLESYFGSEVEFEEFSDLECLRIPHFYSAFYVYKYATGISAAIALSENVLNGGKQELDNYLSFLKSGGSKFPIDSLKSAGVDMSTTQPVLKALDKFKKLLDQRCQML